MSSGSVEVRATSSTGPDDITWDPGLAEKNGDRASDDRAAIAYLGELDNGGSAISVPATNDDGLLQIAPMDGQTSLTEVEPGGPRGGPERYWPSGRRTFARLVPTDLSVATALVDWAREEGARRIAIVHDDHVHGRALAAQAVFVADARKLPVVTVKEVEADDEPEDYADTAESLREEKERPDAIVYMGVATRTGAQLLPAIGKALPQASLYAAGFPPETPIPGADVRIVAPIRPARGYPPRAQRILDRIARDQGGAVPPVAALYGYESMRLTLEAIDRAGPNAGDRAAVVREALRAGPRSGSVLGDLRITGTGDVADQRVQAYRRSGDHLVAEGLRTPRPPALPPQPGDPAS